MRRKRVRYEAPPESPGFYNYKRKNFVRWERVHEIFAEQMAEFDRLPRAVRDVWNERGAKAAKRFHEDLKDRARGNRWTIPTESEPATDAYVQAKEILELTSTETDALFFPDSQVDIDYRKVTPLIAADVVEHFALTGEISWPEKVLREDEPEAEFARS